MAIVPVQLGETGIGKQIFLGCRERDRNVDYLSAFMQLATEVRWQNTGQSTGQSIAAEGALTN